MNLNDFKFDDTEFDKTFLEHEFPDLEGNSIVLKPWSLKKEKQLKIFVAKIYAEVKEATDDEADFVGFFQDHLDKFFEKCFEEFCEIIRISCDKDEKWLDNVDNALALYIIRIILLQNFTGPRVMNQVNKFLDQTPTEKRNPVATNQKVLAGNL